MSKAGNNSVRGVFRGLLPSLLSSLHQPPTSEAGRRISDKKSDRKYNNSSFTMSFSSSPKCSALSLFYVLPDGIINQFSLKSSVVGHTITIVDTEVKLMSLWRKRLGKNLWDVTMSLLKKRQGALGDVSGRDRHTVKKAVPAMARKHIFSRRFYYLGGLYLATIVVLLLFAFLRLGVIPAPEVPGLDKDWTGLTNDEQAGESMPEEADSHARTGTGAGQQGFASPESQPVESSPAHTGENFMPAEEDHSTFPRTSSWGAFSGYRWRSCRC